jgi:hypothetical protein
VADAAGLDFDPHAAGVWLRNLTFNNFKRSARSGDLGNAHFWHNRIGFCFFKRAFAKLSSFLA